VDGLTTAYTLSPLNVSPMDLLLDPTNPRLITDSAQFRDFTLKEICATETQDYVLELVCKKEHDVGRLISSIEEMGFVGGLHEMIVKPLNQGGPYLVIEGNRRTAALRHLLARKEGLRPDVRRSIEQIEVKLFNHRKESRLSEEEVIETLLGRIHIDGPKEWGALERAHYVHRAYRRDFGENKRFRYTIDVSQQVGARFNMSAKAVHKALIVCRAYEQLKRASVGIDPKHYSLLDLAVKTRAVAVPYFEVDRDACQLSNLGIERFTELVLKQDAPIHNPKLFDMFVEVYIDGTELELKQLVSADRKAEDICFAIRKRRDRRGFKEDLEAVKEGISALYVDDFRGTEGEKALIRRINELVAKRLLPLILADDL
jgi:hypothetical protein